MEKNIIANQLSAKLITSQEVTVNGRDINEWLKERISELELDPVFKNWLSAESKLSDIGQNEISAYAKKSQLSDYAEKSELTAYAEKEELTAYAEKSELSDYAQKSDIPTDFSSLSGDLSATDLFARAARICTTGTQQYYVNLGYPAYNSGMQIGYDTATAHYLAKMPQAGGFSTSLLNAELSTKSAYNKMDIDVKGKIKVTNGTTTATFQLPIDRGATTENVATREWTNSQLTAIGDLEDRVGALEDYKDEYIDPEMNRIDSDLADTRQQLGNVYFDNDEESSTNLYLVADITGETYGDAAGFAVRSYDNTVKFYEEGFRIGEDLNVHFPAYYGGCGYLLTDSQVMKKWYEFVDPESIQLQYIGHYYPNAIIDIKLLTQSSIAIYPDADEIPSEEQAQEFQMIIDLSEYEGNGNPMINFITNSDNFLLDLFDDYQGFDCFEAGNIYSVKVLRFPYTSFEGFDEDVIDHYADYKTMITVRKLISIF